MSATENKKLADLSDRMWAKWTEVKASSQTKGYVGAATESEMQAIFHEIDRALEAMPPSESVLDSLEAAKRQAEERIAELYKKAKAFAKNGYPANEQDCLREIKGIEFVLAILPTQAKQRASKGSGAR